MSDETQDDGDAGYNLVVPFLDGSKSYAKGVEFGMLYERMQRLNEINDIVSTTNQEQVCLLANRTGWKIESMKRLSKDWVQVEMSRNVPLPE